MLTDSFAPETETLEEQYAPSSPFLESFAPEAGQEQFDALLPDAGLESPFRSEYAGELGERAGDTEREGYETLVSALFENGFSEAIYELAAEASADRLERYGASEVSTSGETRAFFEQYLNPLASETEATFERLAEQYASHDIAMLSEDEVDRLFEAVQPSMGHLSPAFEQFFGALWRKAKSLGKAVVGAAKAGLRAVGKIVPLGWIFDKLKGLVKPLLRRVLQMAIGRLPLALQPVAKRLSAKLFGEQEVEAYEAAYGEQSYAQPSSSETEAGRLQLASPDPDVVQREFDARLAQLLYATDEAEQEAVATESASESEQEAEDREGALDVARERFVAEVGAMERGTDPTAQMEQFLPVVMAALKIGITVVGRQRVVGFLAGYLAKVLSPYVGREVGRQLSDAIVSTGMSIVGLEAPANREALAGEAVANAVEGTLRRLAEQGPQVFEDPRVLEAAVQEAFSEAAAESFPPAMVREQLHETSGRSTARGTWVLRPRQGRRRYRRYTQVLDITVTPQIAAAVPGFGCIPLREVLRARYGLTPPVRMKAYLYEAVCGTTISAIARHEGSVPGLGTGAQRPWQMFIPLSRQTAGLLFGEPGLGRDVDTQFAMSPRRVCVGQRFVVLVPDGARPSVPRQTPVRPYPTDVKPPPLPGRPSQVNVTLDLPRTTATIYIHLSDADDQSVVASVRRGESATPVLLLLRGIYVATLRSMLSGSPGRHIKIVHEAAAGEQFAGAALSAVGSAVLKKILDKVLDFLGKALAEYFTRRRQEYLTASEKRAGGVTIVVTLRHTSMFTALSKALKGDGLGAGLALTRALLAPAEVSVRTVPGFVS